MQPGAGATDEESGEQWRQRMQVGVRCVAGCWEVLLRPCCMLPVLGGARSIQSQACSCTTALSPFLHSLCSLQAQYGLDAGLLAQDMRGGGGSTAPQLRPAPAAAQRRRRRAVPEEAEEGDEGGSRCSLM